MNEENVLVSVIVLCYNAQNYLLDALSSIKDQSYRNIELIFSDDCSKDDSYSIAKAWIDENSSRFNGVQILKTAVNSGVTINCDMAHRAAKGEWIKIVAGDDILPPDCIENFVKLALGKENDGIVSSKYVHFKEENGERRIVSEAPSPVSKWMLSKSAKEQYRIMLRYNVMFSTHFISKKLLEEIDYYETSFPEIDDYPLSLKIARTGHRVIYSDDFIGYYHRIGHDSISGTSAGMLNVSAFKVGGKLDREIDQFVLPYIKKTDYIYRYHLKLDRFRRHIIIDVLNNRNDLFSKFVMKCLYIIDPIEVRKKIIGLTYK